MAEIDPERSFNTCQILLSNAPLLAFAGHTGTLADTNGHSEAAFVLIQ
jgi:hypothetical protein